MAFANVVFSDAAGAFSAAAGCSTANKPARNKGWAAQVFGKETVGAIDKQTIRTAQRIGLADSYQS